MNKPLDPKRIRYVVIAAVTVIAASASLIPLTAGTAPATSRDEIVTLLAARPVPNVPGKRVVSLIIDYPPGSGSVPHHHAQSAFIYAYVLAGEIRSRLDDEPTRIYRAGDWWFENPGARHRESVNASATRPARLLAVFFVDAADTELTIPDAAMQRCGSDCVP